VGAIDSKEEIADPILCGAMIYLASCIFVLIVKMVTRFAFPTHLDYTCAIERCSFRL